MAPNDIGSVKGITGTSISLNGQPGQGTQKPSPSVKTGPDSPPRPADGSVPMPK